MGIEIAPEYGGSGCNFMTTILTIEEISKVDAAVAVLVDIHNTLVNSVITKLGTEEQKNKYLPRLATDTVSNDINNTTPLISIQNRVVASPCQKRRQVRTHLL